MKYRTYRNTNLAVSEVGFGLWTVSTGWWGNFSESEAIALMHKIIPNLIYAETYNINKTFVAELPAVASRESWDALAIEHQPEPKKDNLQ